MLKSSGTSALIALVALGLMFTPFIGPPGMCATASQVITLAAFLLGSAMSVLILIAFAIRSAF